MRLVIFIARITGLTHRFIARKSFYRSVPKEDDVRVSKSLSTFSGGRTFVDHVVNFAALAASIAAVVAVTMRLRDSNQSQAAAPALVPVAFPDWRNLALTGQRVGARAPKVTIVWFSDFQCGYCKQAAADFANLLEAYPSELAVVNRHFPLSFHRQARPAAFAALCASKQARFSEMQRELFARQDSLGILPWVHIARDAGITDTLAFSACMSDSATASALRSDSLSASPLKIPGTPVIFVNEWRFDGYPGAVQLEAYVKRALAERVVAFEAAHTSTR